MLPYCEGMETLWGRKDKTLFHVLVKSRVFVRQRDGGLDKICHSLTFFFVLQRLANEKLLATFVFGTNIQRYVFLNL